MSRRFRPTDAFVDESIRGQRYLMACVLIQAHDMSKMRADVGDLAGTKSTRVHFNAELDSRRQTLLQTFAELPIESWVVISRRRHGVSEFVARSRCLGYIVAALACRSGHHRRAGCDGRGNEPPPQPTGGRSDGRRRVHPNVTAPVTRHGSP